MADDTKEALQQTQSQPPINYQQEGSNIMNDATIVEDDKEIPKEESNKEESTWEDADFLSLDVLQEANDDDDNQEDEDEQSDDDNDNEEEDDESSLSRGMTLPTYADTHSNHSRDPRQRVAFQQQQQQQQQQKLPPWMMTTPNNTANQDPLSHHHKNPLVALHNEIVDFCSLMEPMEEEIQERQVLLEKVKAFIHSVFDDDDSTRKTCEVCLFGSQATGLFLPSSDIDLVVQLKGYENDGENDEKDNGQVNETTSTTDNTNTKVNAKRTKLQEKKEMDEWDNKDATQSPLVRLGTALNEQWRDELSYLEVIPNTRVPLVKFTHASTNISVDICFNQDTGPKAAELVKTYLNAMPPLRPLTFVMKYFMEARGMNEPYSGGVGSFMLQLMIVSFLQHRERDGYNFQRPTLANLGCLLVEFLELYGIDFNYVTTGISVRHDGFYFPKGHAQRKEFFFQPSRPFSLAMENPLEPTADVGKPSFRIQTVQRSFEVAFKVLLAHATEPRVQSPDYGSSILASILPPTKEMKHRALLKKKKMSSNNNNNSRNSYRQQQQYDSQRNNDSYSRKRSHMDEPSRKKRRRR